MGEPSKPSSGGRGLNFSARLNINEVKQNAAVMTKIFQQLKADATAALGSNANGTKAFDVKPLTEYQAAQLKIKQDTLDLAKAKQEAITADKSASLALQNALKDERLAREAILTQIAANRLAQQQANAEAKAAADLQRQTATQKSPGSLNFQSQAEEVKKLAASYGGLQVTQDRSVKSDNLQVNSMNAKYVAYAKLSTEMAKQSAAEGTLTSLIIGNTSAVNTNNAANNQGSLSKQQLAAQAKELAVQLAAEKLRTQQSTAETKNNAREQINAKGSLEQRKAALERLITVYGRLSVAERDSAAGNRLAGIIAGLRDQIKGIDDQTKNSSSGIAAFFDSIKNNILGTLGPLALLTAAWAAAKSAFNHNVEISDSFVDVQRTAKLSGEEVDSLAEKLKRINTRTSLEGLLDIGFIGGRLGVAKDDLVGFIQQVDELAVVLKKEFPGGAEAVATSLGKIINVYKITQREGISLEDALRKTGSAFLELSHNGGAPVQYLQDFALGTAGIAQVTKLSLPTLLAYGSVLSKANIQASTAATGVTRFLSDLSTKREKYFAIAQLADSTLTIEKFTKLINTDAKTALDLFFKGLRAGNPTTTETGDRLKTLSLTAGKVKNTIIALAEAQGTLATSTTLINRAYDEGTSVNHNFELANNSLAASFEKIKNGIVNYFTSASNGRALAELLNSFTDTRTESEKLTEEYQNNKKRLDDLDGATKPLLEKYDLLKGKSKLTKVEQEELRIVTAKIGELLPGVTTKFDEYGNSLDINRTKITELSKAQREYLELQNRSAIQSARQQFDLAQSYLPGAQKGAADPNKTNNTYNKIYDALYGGDRKTDADIASKDRITRLSASAYQAAKSVRDLGGVLTEAEKKVIAYYEALDNAKKPKKENVTVIQPEAPEGTEANQDGKSPNALKAEIKALVTANNKLGKESEVFKANIVKINGLKKDLKDALAGKDTEAIAAASQYATALKSRNDLQAKIDEMVKKGTDKQLSADDQEIESVKDKYAKMRAEAVAYNLAQSKDDADRIKQGKKPLNLRTDAGGIANAQRTELVATVYKQDTEKLNIELDKQKVLYAQFEQFKTDFGEAAAKKRFEKDINTNRTLLEDLEAQRAELLSKDPLNMTGAEKDRLTGIDSRINEEVKNQKAAHAALLVDLRNYQQQATGLDTKYAAKKKGVLEDSNLTPEGKEYQIKLLDELYRADTDNLKESIVEKSAAYQRLTEQVTSYTKQQLKSEIDAIEYALKNATDLAPKLKEALAQQLQDVKVRLSLGGGEAALQADLLKKKKEIEEALRVGVKVEIDASGNLKTVKLTSAQIKQLVKDLAENDDKIKKSTKDKFIGISKYLDLAATSFDELAQAVGDSNTGLANTFLALSQVAKAAAEASKSFAVLTDPDSTNFDKVSAGVNGLVSALSTIFGAGAKRKKELEDYYRSVTAMQNEYNISLNEQIRLQGTLDESIYLKNYTGRVGDAMKAASDAQKKLNELIPQLGNGQAVTGKRNAVDWGAVGKATAGGAVAGATVGSIVPVIGTIVGGAVGAVVGFLGGLFGGKKKVDTLAPLLKEYPELITKMQDGTVSFNTELAKSLVANNLVTAATKDVLNNIVDWQKQLEAARQQIKDVVTELSGGLGNDLRDALVQSFKDGTNAAKAFGDSVNKVLENILSNILFNAVFSDTFKQLETDLTAALDPTNIGGKSVIDALSGFLDKAPGLIDAFDALLGSSKDLAAAKGLNIFGKSEAASTSSSIADSIISGFKQGKKSAADFADDFKGLMEDAALSAFKANYLNKAIEGFYKQFTAASADGLSDADVKTLKDAYSKIIQDSADQLAGFDKVIGGIGKPTSTGATTGIVSEALTEGTANRVLGITIAQHDTLKATGRTTVDIYQMSVKQFNETVNISKNTLRIADNSELLIDIAADMKILADGKKAGTLTFDQSARDNGIKLG